jgi:hypothetical protein
MLSNKSLANIIARDIMVDREPSLEAPICFACGRSYSKGDGRFCSTRCRAGFDAGLPPYEDQRARYRLSPTGDGFRIECKECRRPFVSKGLRCCSTECERKFHERREIEATMAEVGMEPIARERRKCAECGATIPMWRKGRKVSAATRFCSESCAGKARRKSAKNHPMAAPGQTPSISLESA